MQWAEPAAIQLLTVTEDVWTVMRWTESWTEQVILPNADNNYIYNFYQRIYTILPEGLVYNDSQQMFDYFNWAYRIRDQLAKHFSWALPTPYVIRQLKAIINGRTVLEVAAGTGLWARLLTLAGVNIIATDAYVRPRTWTHVEPYPAKPAIKHFIAEVLFICWGHDQYILPIIKRWLRQPQAQTIIVIGEAEGNCTFNIDKKVAAGKYPLKLDQILPMKQFFGLHDSIYVYQKI